MQLNKLFLCAIRSNFSGTNNKYGVLIRCIFQIFHHIIQCVANATLYPSGLSAHRSVYELFHSILMSWSNPWCCNFSAVRLHITCWAWSSQHSSPPLIRRFNMEHGNGCYRWLSNSQFVFACKFRSISIYVFVEKVTGEVSLNQPLEIALYDKMVYKLLLP